MSRKRNNKMGRIAAGWLLVFILSTAQAGLHQDVQARIDRDVAAGKPVVVHVVVVLADNFNQGIVPVSLKLGNGQNPKTNLYWGALYGVRTWFKRQPAWRQYRRRNLRSTNRFQKGPLVLEQMVYGTYVKRKGKKVELYLVAEAWDGRYMKRAIKYYYNMLAGKSPQRWSLVSGKIAWLVHAGSNAHAIVFIGHNGLMDFSIKNLPTVQRRIKPRSGIVLACKSRQYFQSVLRKYRVQPLLLTKGLMAPEAYTLDSAIRSWARGGSVKSVHRAAARAYQRFQKIPTKASRWLFYSSEN